ncbi:MAG: hypothetical protein Q8P90_03145 [bacterium]|nr:hypothetical protein [bacterium]
MEGSQELSKRADEEWSSADQERRVRRILDDGGVSLDYNDNEVAVMFGPDVVGKQDTVKTKRGEHLRGGMRLTENSGKIKIEESSNKDLNQQVFNLDLSDAPAELREAVIARFEFLRNDVEQFIGENPTQEQIDALPQELQMRYQQFLHLQPIVEAIDNSIRRREAERLVEEAPTEPTEKFHESTEGFREPRQSRPPVETGTENVVVLYEALQAKQKAGEKLSAAEQQQMRQLRPGYLLAVGSEAKAGQAARWERSGELYGIIPREASKVVDKPGGFLVPSSETGKRKRAGVISVEPVFGDTDNPSEQTGWQVTEAVNTNIASVGQELSFGLTGENERDVLRAVMQYDQYATKLADSGVSAGKYITMIAEANRSRAKAGRRKRRGKE